MITASPETGNRLRLLWLGLLALNIVLLLSALPGLLRGEADGYTNQHARLVVGSLTGVFISAAGVSKSAKPKWWLLGAAFLTIGISLWLAR